MNFKIAISFALTAILILSPGCGGGGGGGSISSPSSDTTPPVLTMVYPEPNSSFSESVFRAESFYIQFSYQDTSLMDESTISVSFQMDAEPAQDITSYFSTMDTGNIKSADLYSFTRSLYVMPTNMVDRLMKITVSIKDKDGNMGSVSARFTVQPVAPPRSSGEQLNKFQ